MEAGKKARTSRSVGQKMELQQIGMLIQVLTDRIQNVERDLSELKLAQAHISEKACGMIAETKYIEDIGKLNHKIDKITDKLESMDDNGKKRDALVQSIERKYDERLDTLEQKDGNEALRVNQNIKDKLIDKAVTGLVSAVIIIVPLWLTGVIGQ